MILYGKPGCHLCDDALAIISRVCTGIHVAWEERNILDDPEAERRYWDKIPVTLVDGIEHSVWHVDEDRLRSALLR